VLADGNDGAVLRHELVASTRGHMRVLWPLAVRWMHDALIEVLLDRAENATGTRPALPHRRSWWVRRLLTLRPPHPRQKQRPPTPLPTLH